jgi:predicted transcriptional regulator
MYKEMKNTTKITETSIMSEQTTIDVKFELMMEKLENLHIRYDEHNKQDADNFAQIREKVGKLVDKLDVLLLDSEKGILFKMDRLSQNEKKRSWLIKTAVGSGMASVFAHIWQFIKS